MRCSAQGTGQPQEKANTLAYFETLCADTATANMLINSSLAALLVRMLRVAKVPALRARLAGILGVLVRHSTFISDDLAATGVISVLADCSRDKAERVRRRASASLGELLFYVATQQADGAARAAASDAAASAAGSALLPGEAWQVPATAIAALLRLLRAGEDEVTQHYAAKTVENIASAGGDWPARVASPEVASALVVMVQSSRSEQLRGTAASALSRLCRAAPALLAHVLDKYGIKLLLAGLQDGAAKVQQVGLDSSPLKGRGLRAAAMQCAGFPVGCG